jgi:hypothetical protein
MYNNPDSSSNLCDHSTSPHPLAHHFATTYHGTNTLGAYYDRWGRRMHFHGSIHGSDSRTYMSEPVGWVCEGQFSTIGHPNNNWHPHGTPPASPQANAAAGVYHFGESVEPVPYVAGAGHVTQQAFPPPPPPPQQAVLPPTPAYGGAAVTKGAVANGAVANRAVANGAVANGAVANEVPPLPPLPPPA